MLRLHFILLITLIVVSIVGCTDDRSVLPGDEEIEDSEVEIDAEPDIDNELELVEEEDEEDKRESLKINEIAALGDLYDWFEIYNPSDERINLMGYSFQTDPLRKAGPSQLPAGVIVEAQGFYLVQLDSSWPGYLLDDEGRLTLFDSDGEISDSVAWNSGDCPQGQSYGRIPDGEDELKTLQTPTPGAANIDNPSLEGDGDEEEDIDQDESQWPIGQLVFNEVAASEDPNDWFELYNNGDGTISLADYRFSPFRNDPYYLSEFVPRSTIAPNSFFLVQVNGEWPGWYIPANGELFLFAHDGTLMDQVDWQGNECPEGQSYGRIPDGSGSYKTLETQTPGAPNIDNPTDGDLDEDIEHDDTDDDTDSKENDEESDSDPDPDLPESLLVINEVAANGDPTDWVEIYNGTGETIDLSTYRLANNTHGNFDINRLPPSSFVAPYGHFTIAVTEQWPGFTLDDDGAVGLFTDDATYVDSADWDAGQSPEGQSYGRIPSGTGEFRTLSLPTPGLPNVP